MLIHHFGVSTVLRSTVRIVSWLTAKSAANSRKLRLSVVARMVAFWLRVSLLHRGVWYEARFD
jgi:hypothetical protein